MIDYCKILKEAKTIAIVGLSGNPLKISRSIASYLVSHGYKMAGINPAIPEIDGISVYKSLTEVPFKIDIVNVFRRSETIPDLLDDVLAVNPKVFWLQTGIFCNYVIEKVEKKGIIGIQDNCIMVTHRQCK